jgi:hypothetical protein
LIFMIFFKKVCTCPETSEYFLPKRKTSWFCKRPLKLLFAIKIWILSDGEMFLSMFQILDKSQPKRTDNKTSVYCKNGLEFEPTTKLFAAKNCWTYYSEFKDSESHMFYFYLSTTTIIYKAIDAGRHQQILWI